MNARLILMFAVFACAGIVASELFSKTAQAEWYRPMTWGDKKPTVSSRPHKNNGMIGGTKRALSRTADALMPWDNKKKKDNPHDGAGRFFRPDIAHRKQENEATWYRPATWFRGESEPEKPLTVTDWMAQDRPEFENR